MKLKDINVGDELYWNTRQDWRSSSYGAHKVTVLDNQVKTWYWNWKTCVWQPSYTTSYSMKRGILVERVGNSGAKVQDVVTIISLRGPYEQTKIEVERIAAEQRALADQLSAKRKAQRDLAEVARVLVQSMNVSAYLKDQSVVVGAEQFHAMALELEKQGWSYVSAS